MRIATDRTGGLLLVFERSEINAITSTLESGLVQTLVNLPFPGVEQILLFGTKPSDGQGNLRAFVIQKGEGRIDAGRITNFLSQLGKALGYSGTLEANTYDELTYSNLEDALYGSGEFPFFSRRNPET